MFKNIYGKISEAFINMGGQPVKRTPAPPFESTKKTEAAPFAPMPESEGSEKKVYEQEHFDGHEAECDFCLSESLENLNGEKLKEYIIFSEILGKPKSKRRM